MGGWTRLEALWGPRCFSYESQGLGWGGCCGILIVAEYIPNSRKERPALSYDPDTRRPHWLAQLINLGMENWFILGMKDPTTISFILCTSPRNGGSILYGGSADTLVVPSLGLSLLLSHRFSSALISNFHQALSSSFLPDPRHPTFLPSSPSIPTRVILLCSPLRPPSPSARAPETGERAGRRAPWASPPLVRTPMALSFPEKCSKYFGKEPQELEESKLLMMRR